MYTTLVLDYGHGSDTPGKRYRFTDHDDFECREYMTNRLTAAILIPMLVEKGYRVYDCVADRYWTADDIQGDWCWHQLEQSDVPLSIRTLRANRISRSMVLSLHSNAVGYSNVGPSLKPRGGVMYTSPGETRSDAIAEALWHSFTKAFEDEPVFMRGGDTRDGDHDMEARFWMLTKTRAPAVLGEMLFFVNIDDARYLMSEHGQQVIAQAYFDGIVGYLTQP